MEHISNTLFRRVANQVPGHALSGVECDLFVHDSGLDIRPSSEAQDESEYVVDGSHLTLLPGLIELHAEANQPGREDREALAELAQLAAMGGFTHVVTMPLTVPVTDQCQGIEYQLKTAQNELVQLLPAGAVTKKSDGLELAEMYDMRGAGAIAFSDYKRRIKNTKLLLLAMQYAKQLEVPLMLTPGDSDLLRYGMVHEGIFSTRLGLKSIPSIAESIGLKRDLDLVRYTGCRVHFQSISTIESIELIRKAKDEGLPVTADVNFYHLLLTDAMLENFDSNYKTDPPLRDDVTQDALIKAVKDGTIDAISADHQPRTFEEKICEFDKAEYGMLTLPFVFGTLIESGLFSLDLLMEKMCINPAKILGLSTENIKSYCLVDLDKTHVIKKDDFSDFRSLNSPFFDRRLKGKIAYVVNKNTCLKNSF
ncbi:MAG: dihydroorotase [Thermaurantimonas sp.]